MTLRRQILDALEDRLNGLCDACLRESFPGTSHQHVNAICRLLESEGRLIREKSRVEECEGCGKVRVINRLVLVSNLKSKPSASSTVGNFGINELDGLRRQMIQFMNGLDPGSARDGFSKRVASLRNSQLLPPQIAALMLTHAAYRNAAYYNAYDLVGDEQYILELISKYLRAYITNNHS